MKSNQKTWMIVQIMGTAKLEISAAEDQCSTKFSELENIAAEKNIGVLWIIASGRKSKLFTDIRYLLGFIDLLAEKVKFQKS